jgi:hypothetical protein
MRTPTRQRSLGSGSALALRGATLLAVVVLLGAAGCGSTQTIDTTRTFAGAPVGLITTEIQLLRACIEKAGARLELNAPRPHKGRIAIAAAGNLPAIYVGAIVWPNGAYSDVWLAFNPVEAAMAAEKLNRAQAEAQGVSKVNAAYTYGRAVSAPGDIEGFGQLPELEKAGELPPEAAAKADTCLAETNTRPASLR